MDNFIQVQLFTEEECNAILDMPRVSQDRSTTGKPYTENWINGKRGAGIQDTIISPEKWVTGRIDSTRSIQNFANTTGCWPLMYKEYWTDNYVGYHTDGVRGIKRVGISISLNNDYDGGKLQFASWKYQGYSENSIKDVEVDTPIGVATIFPIFIPHRVTKVTSGIRKQLVTWLTGPQLNW